MEQISCIKVYNIPQTMNKRVIHVAGTHLHLWLMLAKRWNFYSQHLHWFRFYIYFFFKFSSYFGL